MYAERLNLPPGIQTFRELREGGYYYVDKTGHIRQLVERGKHNFLSRPRRFGKSLLLDTIKELFEGSEELFQGLDIHDKWDWQQRHPVVRLSFGGDEYTSEGFLRNIVLEQLDNLEQKFGVASKNARGGARRWR